MRHSTQRGILLLLSVMSKPRFNSNSGWPGNLWLALDLFRGAAVAHCTESGGGAALAVINARLLAVN